MTKKSKIIACLLFVFVIICAVFLSVNSVKIFKKLSEPLPSVYIEYNSHKYYLTNDADVEYKDIWEPLDKSKEAKKAFMNGKETDVYVYKNPEQSMFLVQSGKSEDDYLFLQEEYKDIDFSSALLEKVYFETEYKTIVIEDKEELQVIQKELAAVDKSDRDDNMPSGENDKNISGGIYLKYKNINAIQTYGDVSIINDDCYVTEFYKKGKQNSIRTNDEFKKLLIRHMNNGSLS